MLCESFDERPTGVDMKLIVYSFGTTDVITTFGPPGIKTVCGVKMSNAGAEPAMVVIPLPMSVIGWGLSSKCGPAKACHRLR